MLLRFIVGFMFGFELQILGYGFNSYPFWVLFILFVVNGGLAATDERERIMAAVEAKIKEDSNDNR